MTLREKQSVFAWLVAKLIIRAESLGYQVTLGEAWRSPEEAARLAAAGKGIKKSQHTRRLAIDLNLFRDGEYLKETEDHISLGQWWEEQSDSDITCRWGGRFRRPDGNHYEVVG